MPTLVANRMRSEANLIAALELVDAGGVKADFHSDGAMKFAGSGRKWPSVWRAHESGLIAPEGEWVRGRLIMLTAAGRAALLQARGSN